jgi:hypothetical protein
VIFPGIGGEWSIDEFCSRKNAGSKFSYLVVSFAISTALRPVLPDIQKISVAVTGEQLAALRAAVETGEYATTSEIIRVLDGRRDLAKLL